MNKRTLPVCAALLIGSLAAGCSLLPDRPTPPAVHDFGPTRPARSSAPAWSTVTVQAPDWLRDPKLRYRLLYREPTRVQFYALDRWVAPPPELLAQALSAASGPAGCPLHIDLQRFEQVFPKPDQARVVVELLARTVLPGPGSDRNLAAQPFSVTRPCPSANAAGAVAAFSLAVAETAQRLAAWYESLPNDALSACTRGAGTPATGTR